MSTTQYTELGGGFCSDWEYLPEGGYPEFLSDFLSDYSDDKLRECMNRCLSTSKASIARNAFYVRSSDQKCACSEGCCSSRTGGSSGYTSYRIEPGYTDNCPAELEYEGICGDLWAFPLLFLYALLALAAGYISWTAIKAIALNMLLSKHRLHGQTVDGRCLSKWSHTSTSTSTDSEGNTTTSTSTSYYFTVRYAVRMPMPSATGGRFYRVTKKYENISKRLYSQVEEGPTQMNHIMALTNDARSAVLQKSMDQDTPAKLTAIALGKILATLAAIVGVCYWLQMMFTMGQSDDGGPSIISCGGFWGVVALILSLFLLCAALRARAVAKRPP
jgi:hypothetical protein